MPPASAFPFPVAETRLSNGLRALAIRYDSPGLVAFHSVVRAGSRNEVEPGKTGFAHFFEHMMFRGTDRYPTDAYNDVLKAMGADSNAFTSNDVTVYHILAGKDALPRIVEIEADRFQNLRYSEQDFQKEARAVLGEYNKGASDPMQKLEEALCDAAFTRHTYKHTTIGFLRDIEDMPNQVDYGRQFFDRYYRPDNVVLLVVGDVEPGAAFGLIERHYAAWKPGPPRPPVPQEPPQTREQRVRLTWPDETLPMLLIGHHVPAFSTAGTDSAALEILAELLFSKKAPLYRKLVLEEQLVESISGGAARQVDPGLFTVHARVKDAAALGRIEDTVGAELRRVAERGVEPDMLDAVRAHLRYAFAGALSTADRVALVAGEFVGLTGGVAAIDAHMERIAAVEQGDVRRVAAAYFAPQSRTVVTLTPEAK